jgi:hypothetical protein
VSDSHKRKEGGGTHLAVPKINGPGTRSLEHAGNHQESNKEQCNSSYPRDMLVVGATSSPAQFILEPKGLAHPSKDADLCIFRVANLLPLSVAGDGRVLIRRPFERESQYEKIAEN